MGMRSSSLCSTTMKVIPSSRLSFSIRETTSSAVLGSRREVGSSRIISLGRIAITPARAARCFCPSESSWGALSARAVIPRSLIASSTRDLISSLGTERFWSPKAMSLSTENMKIWFSGFWKRRPTFWARTLIGVSSTLRPPTETLPLYSPGYMCGIRPLMQRRRVDLPHPLGPARRTTSPSPHLEADVPDGGRLGSLGSGRRGGRWTRGLSSSLSLVSVLLMAGSPLGSSSPLVVAVR